MSAFFSDHHSHGKLLVRGKQELIDAFWRDVITTKDEVPSCLCHCFFGMVRIRDLRPVNSLKGVMNYGISLLQYCMADER